MDQIAPYVSNLVRNQFPQRYKEHGQLLVDFVTNYYKWMEEKSLAADNFFNQKYFNVSVRSQSANVVGSGTRFTTELTNGYIAICNNLETEDYNLYRIESIANNTFLTLKDLPTFTSANTKYASVSEKPNANWFTRNHFDIQDIDNTFDEYVVFFKEKYLKNLQFDTLTNTKTLVKHSLDLYRSKGTERSIDLLYKIVFGKPAKVYYPGQDMMRASAVDWHIPNYLELSISPQNHKLINKQIFGVISGATAFVEEIIRRSHKGIIVEIAYISVINGTFLTGEKISIQNNDVELTDFPTIVGSLNELLIDIAGSGSDFELNELVDIVSNTGGTAVGQVTGLANSIGKVSFTLIDGGYGYTNNTTVIPVLGTVSVNSSCTAVTGTSTTFEEEFVIGDLVSIWDGDEFQTRTITDIDSDTLLTVNAVFTIDNDNTYIGHTRNFAQTYVSDKVLTINNVVVNDSWNYFEYASILDEIRQEMGIITFVNANGNFEIGDGIFTYDANDDIIGEGKVLSVSQLNEQGVLTVSVLFGDLNEDAIYTTANAIGANQSVVTLYQDITATANVIGTYANVVVYFDTANGTFTAEDKIHSSNGMGWIVSSNATAILVANSQGIFKSNNSMTSDSGVTANITSIELRVGVVDINNTFSILEGNFINASSFSGSLSQISTGDGANIEFATFLTHTETVNTGVDIIWQHLEDELDGTWEFSGNTSADIDSVIEDTLDTYELTIGRIQTILSINEGLFYNTPPVVRLHDPWIFSHEKPDQIVLHLDNAAEYKLGELVTQENTDARGLIEVIDLATDQLTLQRLRFSEENDFIASTNSTTILIGDKTTRQANIISVETRTFSQRLGSDVNLTYNLTVAEGAITSVKIIDSSFGFINNEVVTIISQSSNNLAEGFAVLKTHGTGTGYFKDKNSFLSTSKYLSDGKYYQEYSYEVQSSVISDFKDRLKDIVHVAGTAYFSALYYDTINITNTQIESVQTILPI